ncbi:MAG: class I SAM-dependent methyltransferase, partial [Luteibaculum sp.]
MELSVADLLNPAYQKLTDYTEPEDIKRFLFIKRHLESLGQETASLRVLDVGCGNGHISRGLARLGYSVVGVDIDPDSIKIAQEACPEASFFCLDVGDLAEQYASEHFHAIICSEVLEHLENPSEMVSTLYPFLAPDGILIVTTPNGFGPRERTVTKPVQNLYRLGFGNAIGMAKKIMGYKGATSQSSNPDLTHIQFFTKQALIEAVNGENNLELLEFGNANYLEKAFPYSVKYKGNMQLKAEDCIRADSIPNEKASGWNTAWK